MEKNKKKVFAYVHTHWDREWYREFEEFRLRLIEVLDKLFTEFDNGNLSSFYFDGQTSAIEDYLAIYPADYKRIKELIEQKKMFVGPFFCSTDEFLTNAESLLTNLSLGFEKSKELGCSDFIAYLSDTFGHSADMPKILEYAGVEYAILWRGLGSLPSEFMWDKIKSTYLIQGYFHDIFSQDVSVEAKALYLQKFFDKIAPRSSESLLLPIGADHLQIPTNITAQVNDVNKFLDGYEITLSTPFEYLKAVNDNYKTSCSSELMDSTENFLLKGVFSARNDLKYLNTMSEWELYRKVQPLQAIANKLFSSKSYKNELDYVSKILIRNQAHDSIYGCGVDAIHSEMITRYKKIGQVLTGVEKRVVRNLSSNTETLSVINLSSFSYTGAMKLTTHKTLPTNYNAQLLGSRKYFTDEKLYNAEQIPITEDITDIYDYLIPVADLPPLSISNVENHIVMPSELYVSDECISNEFVEINITDKVLNFKDKCTNSIYTDFLSLKDVADIGDSYNFGPLKNDVPIYAELKSSKILEKGYVRSVLRLVYEMNIPQESSKDCRSNNLITHIINLDIALTAGSNIVEFETNWENKAKNHLLQVAFNLKNHIDKTFSEDLVSIIERKFDSHYNIYEHIPAPRGVELKTNTMPMQRFVWTQGVGLITKGLREYEVSKNELRLSLLRATGLISEPKNSSRGTPAGPPLEVKDLQMLGSNSAKFAMVFAEAPQSLYQNAENYYYPLTTMFSDIKPQQFVHIDNPKIILSTIKLDSDNKILIRMYNSSEFEQRFSFKHSFTGLKAYNANFSGTATSLLSDTITLSAREIGSVKLI